MYCDLSSTVITDAYYCISTSLRRPQIRVNIGKMKQLNYVVRTNFSIWSLFRDLLYAPVDPHSLIVNTLSTAESVQSYVCLSYLNTGWKIHRTGKIERCWSFPILRFASQTSAKKKKKNSHCISREKNSFLIKLISQSFSPCKVLKNTSLTTVRTLSRDVA